MRYALGWLAVLFLVAGCMTYARGERYTCFWPFSPERCVSPPYHYPPPVPQGPNEVY